YPPRRERQRRLLPACYPAELDRVLEALQRVLSKRFRRQPGCPGDRRRDHELARSGESDGRMPRSVGEGERSLARELDQRRRALQIRVLDQLVLAQVALLEADRADEEAAALLDELRVQPLDRRVLVRPDRVRVAARAEPHAVRRQPQD